MQPFESGNRDMMWKVRGKRIINKGNKDLLDIKRANDDNGAKLCRHHDKEGDNQRWTLESA